MQMLRGPRDVTFGPLCIPVLNTLSKHNFNTRLYWDHEISIIVTSILAVQTLFRRKHDLSSLSIMDMEIMAIHSWKSQLFIIIIFYYIYLDLQ
jgi:hypothetical protein